MGEIGYNRNEFLNDLKFWEIRSIIRGYNARHHANWEQARFIAYHVRYCMGVPKGETPPNVIQWYTFPWETAEPLTDEELEDLQAEIDALDKQNQ